VVAGFAVSSCAWSVSQGQKWNHVCLFRFSSGDHAEARAAMVCGPAKAPQIRCFSFQLVLFGTDTEHTNPLNQMSISSSKARSSPKE